MSEAASPLTLALRRFWADRKGKIASLVLLAFFIVGVYAPLLVSEVALVWWDDNGLQFPIVGDLFNKRSYGKPHDLLFNVLMFMLPVLVPAAWYLRRRQVRWNMIILSSLAVITAVVLLCLLPVLPAEKRWESVWDDRPNTTALWQAEDRAEATTLFPLIPHRASASYYSLRPPMSENPDTGATFWLGTDDRGFDVLGRMIFGARISLTIGLVATGIAMFIGICIGAVSAYFGGIVDLTLQRIVEIMMTFPVFILLLVVVALLGRDIYLIMIVLGLTGWAGTARLVRGEYLAQMGREYVLAGECLGLSKPRIMFVHILPNTLTPLLISASFSIAGSVLTESGLAFIGLGDPNAPSWGALLDVGRRNVGYTWLIWVPGLTVFALVMSLNMIGNSLREALNPKAAQ